MARLPFASASSLWSATAAPAPETGSLETSTVADVAIVGGGYAGLSTALHLAERGVNAVVLEAQEIGSGASGRNGGQVIPGLKYDPADLLRLFGRERGQKLVQFGNATADKVFELIDRHQMDVPHTREGWIQGAHTQDALRITQARAEQWAAHGVPVRLLDKAEITDLMGTTRYWGGWLDPRAGAIQPLSYARGLARAALAAGARIHTQSPVTTLSREAGRWALQTQSGSQIKAERVVLCTNAYGGDLWPRLETSIIRPNSFQVATQPLPAAIQRTILRQGHVSSDTRNLLLYFRMDHTGRLLMGGRGPFREPKSLDDWAHLERAVGKLFPQAAGIPFDYRWCGRVAVTRDFLPHLHEPAPGLLVNIGCQGRGVGLQTCMGAAMAEYVATGDASSLPFSITPIKPLPLYALRRLYVSAVVTWYRLNDGGL